MYSSYQWCVQLRQVAENQDVEVGLSATYHAINGLRQQSLSSNTFENPVARICTGKDGWKAHYS